MKKSIRFKIMTVFFILIIVPLLVLSYVFYNTENSVIIKQIKQTSAKSIENARDFYINNMISEIENSVNTWTDDKDVLDLIKNPESFSNISVQWKGYLKSYPQITSMYVGDKNKNIYLYPYEKLSEDFDCTQRPWYKDAIASKNNDVVWTVPYEDASTKEMTITIAKAIPDESNLGKYSGVLAVDMRLSSLSDISGKIKLGNEGYALIVDSDGTIIGHKDKSQLNTNAGNKGWYKKLMSDSSQSVEYSIDGKEYIISYVTVANTGWKLIGFTPKADIISITKPISTSFEIMLIVMIGVYIVISLLLGFYINHELLDPIKSLGLLMSKVEKGDFNVSFDVNRNDEIGELSKNFNDMINGQKNMIKLYQFN